MNTNLSERKRYENVGKNLSELDILASKDLLRDVKFTVEDWDQPYSVVTKTGEHKFNSSCTEITVKNQSRDWIGTADTVYFNNQRYLKLVLYRVDGRVPTKQEKKDRSYRNWYTRDTKTVGVVYFDRYLQPINDKGEILRAKPAKGSVTMTGYWNDGYFGNYSLGQFLGYWSRAYKETNFSKNEIENFIREELDTLLEERQAKYSTYSWASRIYTTDYVDILKKERGGTILKTTTPKVVILAETPLKDKDKILEEVKNNNTRLYDYKKRIVRSYDKALAFGYKRYTLNVRNTFSYLETIKNNDKDYLVVRCFKINTKFHDSPKYNFYSGSYGGNTTVDIVNGGYMPNPFNEGLAEITSISETRRYYVDKNKNIVQGEKNYKGVWMPPTTKTSYWNASGFIWNIEELEKGTVLQYTKYIKKFFEFSEGTTNWRSRTYGYTPDGHNTQYLYQLIQNCYLEQLINAGYINLTYEILAETNSPKVFMRDYLGIDKIRKTVPLMKAMPLPKAYLDMLEKLCKDFTKEDDEREYKNIVGSFGSLTSIDRLQSYIRALGLDMSFLNNKENIEMIYFVTTKNPFSTSYWRPHIEINEVIGAPTPLTVVKRLYKWGNEDTKGVDPYSLYQDTIRQYRQLHENSVAKEAIRNRNIKTLADLQATHDILINELVQQRAEDDRRHMEELATAFEKSNKKRMKFEEENDKYVIIVPKELLDIKKEGAVLSHCVGGYVNSVAYGDTNILFLRKKETPDRSWYTIEVNNSGRVVQIHGAHNQWLSSTDEGYAAVPFVKKWIDKHELECDKTILLSMAAGYSSYGAPLREAPDGVKI